ncbi:hypothetical protein BDV95DRAFT_570234 [Massariosphaeria phaeospora]|uniref:Uncharacterized protein n=1 Tax=Massariosphaeria phaeospora TaxID=100035 RepID=A0A7C8I7J0_9PLEO|nr:hypothetical protein BDV95DRAFT_570234 [Massariosphaeria phaeospora]
MLIISNQLVCALPTYPIYCSCMCRSRPPHSKIPSPLPQARKPPSANRRPRPHYEKDYLTKHTLPYSEDLKTTAHLLYTRTTHAPYPRSPNTFQKPSRTRPPTYHLP